MPIRKREKMITKIGLLEIFDIIRLVGGYCKALIRDDTVIAVVFHAIGNFVR